MFTCGTAVHDSRSK